MIFQNTTLFIIVLNAVWIFVDVEWNNVALTLEDGSLPLEPVSIVVENLFCFYFTTEVFIRFMGFRKCTYLVRDAWFVFDFTLVVFMVLETWLLPVISIISSSEGAGGILSQFSSFRLLRLLRLTRMARIMRFFPELMTLVKGMVRAMQSVIFILLFLVIVTYIFAIVFTSQLGSHDYQPPQPPAAVEGEPEPCPVEMDETAQQLFADMGSSMMTLFTMGVLGDNLAFALYQIQKESIALMWLFIAFMVMSGMTLLNMLIGVLCQVIDDSSREEEEARKLHELRTCLTEAFIATDESQDGKISEEEWANIRSNVKVQQSLIKLGVEENMMEERLNQMQQQLFAPKKKAIGESDSSLEGKQGDREDNALSFDEFVDQVVEMRMDTPASALDAEMLKSELMAQDKVLKQKLGRIENDLKTILGIPLEEEKKGSSDALVIKTSSKVEKDFSDHASLPGQANVGEEASSPQPKPPKPIVANTPSSSSENWLHDVPTELLFLVLKTRAAAEVPRD